VHLNLALRDPLLPDDDGAELAGPWAGRPDGAPWTAAETPTPVAGVRSPAEPRTLVVAGDGPVRSDPSGMPLIAEPSSGLWGGPGGLRAGALLLGAPEWLAAHRPERVVVLGRPTLSRPVSALLADPAVQVETVPSSVRWADAGRTSARVAGSLEPGPPSDGWTAVWQDAASRVGRAVDAVLDGEPVLTAARVARDTVAALPVGALLVLGSSTPVRDVDRLAVPRADIRVLANRGVAGIDGTISTAIGAALVHQRSGGGPAFTLMGDLTFLHDLTGLLVGDGEPMPDLTIVVPDNDGGGIFAQLEPGQDRYARDYRRVFGTPHGRDLAAVAAGLGWAASRVTTPDELAPALALGGPRVVVVGTDQRGEAELAVMLRQAAAAALA
jgi:2-succinyl-5-enolpyruvyl-6-hydroxy-3-cyclohexene-1-carboxylate synthase